MWPAKGAGDLFAEVKLPAPESLRIWPRTEFYLFRFCDLLGFNFVDRVVDHQLERNEWYVALCPFIKVVPRCLW